MDILSVDGVAAVDAGEGVRWQEREHVAHRTGVEQRAAIAEMKAGVVALAAQGHDVVDGDEALAVRKGQQQPGGQQRANDGEGSGGFGEGRKCLHTE